MELPNRHVEIFLALKDIDIECAFNAFFASVRVRPAFVFCSLEDENHRMHNVLSKYFTIENYNDGSSIQHIAHSYPFSIINEVKNAADLGSALGYVTPGEFPLQYWCEVSIKRDGNNTWLFGVSSRRPSNEDYYKHLVMLMNKYLIHNKITGTVYYTIEERAPGQFRPNPNPNHGIF